MEARPFTMLYGEALDPVGVQYIEEATYAAHATATVWSDRLTRGQAVGF